MLRALATEELPHFSQAHVTRSKSVSPVHAGETAAEGEFQEVGIWGATSEAASHCMFIWRAELERDYTIG